MSEDLCALLAAQLGKLFSCDITRRGHVRIRTPFLFPDGGVVYVFAVGKGSQLEITDFGEALGWLRLQTPMGRRSPKQTKLVEDTRLTLGVDLFKGQLFTRCADASRLADCVMRVGQAAVRVSDLWFTTRTRSIESITDEVEDFLTEQSIAIERAVRLPGRSGRNWLVDFQTKTPRRSSLVAVLSSGSAAAARRVTEHVVAEWYDLSHLKIGGPRLTFISLFDDTSDVWSDEDFRLLDPLSDIVRWSRPDEFLNLIAA
jgi:hypothetical protein